MHLSAVRPITAAELSPGSRVLLGDGTADSVQEVLVDEITRTREGLKVLVFPPGRSEGRRVLLQLSPEAVLRRGPDAEEGAEILNALSRHLDSRTGPVEGSLSVSVKTAEPDRLQLSIGDWLVSLEQ